MACQWVQCETDATEAVIAAMGSSTTKSNVSANLGMNTNFKIDCFSSGGVDGCQSNEKC
jgi:hypothetical protein